MKFDQFKKIFFNGKTDKKDLINKIKFLHQDFTSLQKFVRQIEKEISTFRGVLNEVVLGKHYLPKSYGDLHTVKPIYFTNSLEQEMNWQVLAFLRCHDVINKFIILREEFEHHLLLANYEKARTILEEIETDICVSYWSIENRFIIDEYEFGTEKNWETRNIILGEKNQNFVKIFGEFYSLKSEIKHSFSQYNQDFNGWEKQQSEHKNGGLTPEFREYMRFKANYLSWAKYNFFDIMTYYESKASIIDRYIMFIRVAGHIVAEQDKSQSFIENLLQTLSVSINDINIKQMLLSIGNYSLQQNDCNFETISIIDEYTQGNYVNSKNRAKYYLASENSNYIELYEIYAKSLIEANLAYESITESDSFANKISENFYHILSKNEKINDALVNLIKIAYIFNNSHLAIHLYNFIKNELGWQTEINYSFLAGLNSKFINPKLFNSIFKQKEIAQNYKTNIYKYFENSIAVKLFANAYNNYWSDTVTIDFENVDATKKQLYFIRGLLLKEQFVNSIESYELLLKQPISIVSEYEIVSSLFLCYLMEKQYRNCVLLNVNSYLKNSNLTAKMNVGVVTESIIKSKFKNVGNKSDLIELPIFFKLVCNEKIAIKQAYELFLNANKCTKPSELIAFKENFTTDKFIYFLKNVCITEIMLLSPIFSSTHGVHDERINICKFLSNFDAKNELVYKEEIAELTQKNTISKVIGHIDDGKIYVNEFKIKQIFLKSEGKTDVTKLNQSIGDENYLTREFFDRTVSLKKFVENNEHKNLKQLFLLGIDKDGNVKTENNPVFNDFKKMFLEIREYFVANKEYGLDVYLSTRIRHGTLTNHIRSVFEKYYLITTQTNGVYKTNDFWTRKIIANEGTNDKIQLLLAEFSKQVDNIALMLKENLVQYKTEKRMDKPDALFDYSYKDDLELVLLYFVKTEKYEDFIDLCFTELWKKTDVCLAIIQQKLNNEIKEMFVLSINNLEKNLEELVDRHSIAELLNNINLCRTETQTKLSNISKWFRRSESSFDGEYELQMLAETSIQITKNINPNYQFEIEKEICENFNIKGEYHQHFIDLMNNFLFNMIKHASPNEDLKAKISIIELENNLLLSFKNYVLNPEQHNHKLQQIKNNWKNIDTNISQEGGTGFSKIKKIIHFDLGRKVSNFDFYFEENILTISISFETNELKI